LAGIPLTAGFIGKFYVLMSGVEQNLWLPVIVLVISSVIGLYYYLRIISTLFTTSTALVVKEKTLHPLFYTAMYASLIVLALLLFWVGISPATIIDAIRQFLAVN
jgi:NADH-quinone oxidoreductase subunit N